MYVTRLDSSPAYHPPNHHDMRCLRLQGHEATPSESLWLGLSYLLPGGHTTLDASPLERISNLRRINSVWIAGNRVGR